MKLQKRRDCLGNTLEQGEIMKHENIGRFFDNNIDFYGTGPQPVDYYFVNFIKNSNKEKRLSLADIGGGIGTFANLVVDNCPNITVVVVDPSEKMLSKINNNRIQKVIGTLPNIPLKSKFDYIHVRDVLHHITGSSIKESKELLRSCLLTIRKHLNEDGFLMLGEVYCESYVIPVLSRTLIFYLLALQNKLRIKVPTKDFIMDLSVCFYTRSEFRLELAECGFEIVDYHEEKWMVNFEKKLAFLKDNGRMCFILKAV